MSKEVFNDLAKKLWVDPEDPNAAKQITDRIASMVIAAHTNFDDPVEAALANYLAEPANFPEVEKEEKHFEPGYKKTYICSEWESWEMPLNDDGDPKGRKFMMFDFKNYRTQYWMFIPKF